MWVKVRWLCVFAVLYFASVCLTFMGFLATLWRPSSLPITFSTLMVVCMTLLVGLLFSWGPLSARTVLKFEADVKHNNFERCLSCGYVLRGLPRIHHCPECGAEYIIEFVCGEWKRAFKSWGQGELDDEDSSRQAS